MLVLIRWHARLWQFHAHNWSPLIPTNPLPRPVSSRKACILYAAPRQIAGCFFLISQISSCASSHAVACAVSRQIVSNLTAR